ncbi:MAG: flagellar basal body L-ring protein FlgH [Armatimonadetes bacterium]|nr:flagellar basal body L-ring protein FlgH [Armatimonadota bacterium]
MYKILLLTLTVMLLMSVSMMELRAESLWLSATSKSAYADKRASKVGDTVTVIIEESAVSTQQAATDTKKDTSLSNKPGVGPLLNKVPAFSYSGGDSVKAQGSTTRSMKFVSKMTATVTRVEPNGNLVIEGSRLVQTNKEKEEIKLKGTVRPQDIALDNTVLSTSIANAAITHAGSGPVGSRQKEGIISRIFKILF